MRFPDMGWRHGIWRDAKAEDHRRQSCPSDGRLPALTKYFIFPGMSSLRQANALSLLASLLLAGLLLRVAR